MSCAAFNCNKYENECATCLLILRVLFHMAKRETTNVKLTLFSCEFNTYKSVVNLQREIYVGIMFDFSLFEKSCAFTFKSHWHMKFV